MFSRQGLQRQLRQQIPNLVRVHRDIRVVEKMFKLFALGRVFKLFHGLLLTEGISATLPTDWAENMTQLQHVHGASKLAILGLRRWRRLGGKNLRHLRNLWIIP